MKRTSLLILAFSIYFIGSAQQYNSTVKYPKEIIYLSPLPGSENHNPQTDLVVRFKTSHAIPGHNGVIRLEGTKSGRIDGEITEHAKSGTLIFKPEKDFALSETIQVSIQVVPEGDNFTYSFGIKNEMINPLVPDDFANHPVNLRSKVEKSNDYGLPSDFPDLEVIWSDDPPDGKYFLGIGTTGTGKETYLTILDTLGFPVFFRKNPNAAVDFKLQPNGYLTHYTGAGNIFFELDSAYQQRRILTAANGYTTDMHEMLVLPDDSYWLLCVDNQVMDMSQIVPGGDPNAIVIIFIIQHISASGDVLFQWRSLDHIPILDCDPNFVNLTGRTVDYIHSNAIDIDTDGNILLSSRHLNEITKIDANTGNIIWRWGGSANQFTFIDDPRGFKGQHSIRSHGSHIYTLFNNANQLQPRYSAGQEYQLNQSNKTATLTKEFTSGDPLIFSWAMGHTQRMPNGYTLCGWSTNPNNVALTEFNSLGDKIFELRNNDGSYSYRAFKFPWETNRFSFDQQQLDFGMNVPVGDSAEMTLQVTNNLTANLIINQVHFHDSFFSLATELPQVITAYQSKDFVIRFKPNENKEYMDVMTLMQQQLGTRIGKQIRIEGGGMITASSGEISAEPEFMVFPNPSATGFVLEMKNADNRQDINANSARIRVFDIGGRLIEEFAWSGIKRKNLELSQKGTYFLEVITPENTYRKKLIKY